MPPGMGARRERIKRSELQETLPAFQDFSAHPSRGADCHKGPECTQPAVHRCAPAPGL
jgi:hypothetical protein